MSSPAALPTYGSVACRGVYHTTSMPCRNQAYYVDNGAWFCGVHTKSRVSLPKMSPRAKTAALDAEMAVRNRSIQMARDANAAAGRRGQVALYRMGMMRQVRHRDGFLSVFPNNRHGGRRDGLGLAELSPMRLGPVVHGQPGLENARNLENFWQGSKKFTHETWAAFDEAQALWFRDEVPHRHKHRLAEGEAPPKWIWRDPATEKRHELGWIESRQMYCNFYERLVRAQPEWARLLKLVQGGTNVLLCGYDAVEMASPLEAYLSTAASFGHERVLFTMLTEEDEARWPWRLHKTFQF